MPKLTKRIIEAEKPQAKDVFLRDSDIKGFQCKITPKGNRVYLLYYRTQDGKERRPKIGIHGSITCEQARDIAKQWTATIAQGGDPSGEKQIQKKIPVLSEIGQYYLDAKQSHLKESSWKEMKRIWQRDIIPELGQIKLNHLRVSDTQAFHQKNKARPYQANRALVAISSAINFAIEQKYIKAIENPCKPVKKYPEKSRERFLTKDEMRNLFIVLDECDADRSELPSVTNLIRLLILTGCRLSEILTLKWDYIAWDTSCLRLPDSKTGAKTVYMSGDAMEVLRNIPKAPNNRYVLPGKLEDQPLNPPQKAWRRIRKRAGLDDVRFHDLRHSFASIGAQNGLSLQMIGALLGHSNPQTTARYAHLIGEPLHEAVSLIGKSIKEASEG